MLYYIIYIILFYSRLYYIISHYIIYIIIWYPNGWSQVHDRNHTTPLNWCLGLNKVGFRNYLVDFRNYFENLETIAEDSEIISEDSETTSEDSIFVGIQKLLHGSERCGLGLVQCCFSASLGLLIRWQIWCQNHSNTMHTWDTDNSNDQVMMPFNLSWRGIQPTRCGQYIQRTFHATYLHDGSKLPPTASNTLMGIVA